MLVENLFSIDYLSSSTVVRIPLNLSFWTDQGKNELGVKILGIIIGVVDSLLLVSLVISSNGRRSSRIFSARPQWCGLNVGILLSTAYVARAFHCSVFLSSL
jgi:hypothetical protein